MKLKVFGVIEAEGEPADLAYYTCLIVFVLKDKQDADKKKEVDDWMKKYGDKTFDELMRMESEGEE